MQLFNPFTKYVLKFLLVFAICYFGTLAVIGLSSANGYFNSFVSNHLDYVSWLKASMINATKYILSLWNISVKTEPGFIIRFTGGRGVVIAMSCVGYGVYSFWIAFVVANKGTIIKKCLWILGGLLLLWIINVVRITLLLVAINKQWPMPLGLDHHTWFTIAAYIMIFILIILYDKSFHHKVFNLE